MLQIETLNRKAFASYSLAKRQVTRYGHTLDVNDLDIAIKALDDSITADNNFFKPAHYKGIVYDMKGESANAVLQFKSVLAGAPEAVKSEVEFNIAVAKYHQYSEGFIREAIGILEPLEHSVSEKEKLSPLVKAVLAQCYAMMAHHSVKVKPQDVDGFVLKTKEKADQATGQLQRFRLEQQSFEKEVRWIANNAKGVSLMFKDDKDRDIWKKGDVVKPFKKRLEDAINFFDDAAKYSASNWAITSNQGSARMRIAHLLMNQEEFTKAGEYFREAESFLNLVVTKLRPGYDFAFYELGRINRYKIKLGVENKFKAIEFFDKALKACVSNPNVSEGRINGERDAAEKNITDFNLSDPSTSNA